MASPIKRPRRLVMITRLVVISVDFFGSDLEKLGPPKVVKMDYAQHHLVSINDD